jgi:hypothetical protein
MSFMNTCRRNNAMSLREGISSAAEIYLSPESRPVRKVSLSPFIHTE